MNELEAKISEIDKLKISVSLSPVGWHIDHSLLVINTIVNAVKNSDNTKYKWRFNAIRTLIYTIGKLPRGKVQAPESVRPKEVCTTDKLYADFVTAKANIESLNAIYRNCYFTHPYFGYLNVPPTKTFLKIHTAHYLNIITDILQKA